MVKTAADKVGQRRLCALLAGLVVIALSAANAHAQSLRVRVRGSARIAAHASRAQGELVLSGTLVDDAGEPLRAEAISVLVTREGDPHDTNVAEALRSARGCESPSERTPPRGVRVVGPTDAPEIIVVTDEGGRFCLRARVAQQRYRAHLAWRGSNLVDATDLELPFDLSRAALVLRFDPTPRIVSLDAPSPTLEIAALLEDDSVTHAKRGLVLALTNERGDALGRAMTDASGRARFAVETSRLGPPGPGELRVAFAGDGDTAFATHTAAIERHVNVLLRVPTAERGELLPRVPEDGIPLVVDVTSSAGVINEGTVEARIGSAIVAAAPVERGASRLTLTFTAPGSEALVRLRYVANSPWYDPQGERIVHLPIRGPGLFSKAPILVAGIAVLAFFLVGRIASKGNKAEPARAKGEASPPEGRPRVDVVRHGRDGERGWRGRIVDAHDGHIVRDARVWIERGTFEGSKTLTTASADARGTFELPALDGLVGDEQIGAEGPLHVRLLQPLPAPSELSIALVLRRRAVLARLVAWTRRTGAPFDVRPEATPGHVQRAAGDDVKTALWAAAVEKAAFAGGEIDARLEGEIERMAPRPSSDALRTGEKTEKQVKVASADPPNASLAHELPRRTDTEERR